LSLKILGDKNTYYLVEKTIGEIFTGGETLESMFKIIKA